MAFPLLLFIVFSSLSSISYSKPLLTDDYYSKTCPLLHKIMEETVSSKQITNPTTAAGILRVFFHDCMVEGCDASILIASNQFNKTELDSDINESLPGDAFDLITHAKNALELACPNVVSCSDILAIATRDLVKIVGGPFFQIPLGRKDGLVSKASHVEENLARANTSIDEIIRRFETKGFTVEEMVALMGGGHTIGFSHCKEFGNRIFNFSKTLDVDPSMNPKFAERLRNICENYHTMPRMAAFNDPITPGVFDNMYFQNLLRGLGLLESDQVLMRDTRTRPIVEHYAKHQTAFFVTFAKAMEKTSVYGVKTGQDGEVRVRCDKFNSVWP
ncbi:hypothetical protein CsSME_00006871 [Camellia sinensis var. sinensis]